MNDDNNKATVETPRRSDQEIAEILRQLRTSYDAGNLGFDEAIHRFNLWVGETPQPASENNIDFAMQTLYSFRAIENSCNRRGITMEIYFEEQKLRSLELYKRWKDNPNKEVKFS